MNRIRGKYKGLEIKIKIIIMEIETREAMDKVSTTIENLIHESTENKSINLTLSSTVTHARKNESKRTWRSWAASSSDSNPLNAIKAFHDQPHEVKAKFYYKREEGRGVMYASNNGFLIKLSQGN